MVLHLHLWKKANFFLITLPLQTWLKFNVCMKTMNELNIFLAGFIMCLENVFTVPHCFIKMFYLQQSYGISYSFCWSNSCCAYHELRQGDFYSPDFEKGIILSSYLLLTQSKNLLQERLYLPNWFTISACLLVKQAPLVPIICRSGHL